MKAQILEVRNMSVQRDGKYLLQNINFDLNQMETLSLIGPRGAGKGLLLKALLGIQRGDVTGQIIGAKKFGLVSRAYSCLENFTVFQNLSLVAKFAGVNSQTHLAEVIEEALKSVNLWTTLKSELHKKVYRLSDFQMTCLDLARTLVLKPNIILLDKPTMTFDPENKSQYEAIIEKLKSSFSFIWLNHDLEQAARVSDKILFIKDGKMIEFGSSEDIFTMPLNVETESFISRRVYG